MLDFYESRFRGRVSRSTLTSQRTDTGAVHVRSLAGFGCVFPERRPHQGETEREDV